MDKLKKYISDHRDEFEDEPIIDKSTSWEAVQQKLNQSKKGKIIRLNPIFFKIAAALVLIVGAGIIALQFNSADPDPVVIAKSNEIQDIDSHYSRLVNLKIDQIQNSDEFTDDEKIEFLSFMTELDEDLSLLNTEFKKNLNNQVIIEAIIDNYRERLRILEMLLERVDKIKDHNNENNILL